MAPLERAMVPCVDEKAQIQALDRIQPLLPMRPAQPSPAQPSPAQPSPGQAERPTQD